jgi:predicted nucleic acid-binding protein
MAQSIVLSDASPLIAFALVNRLDLLRSLFGQVSVTEVVKADVLADGSKPGEAAIAEAIGSHWIRVIPDEWPEPQFPALDEGEASTLRVAVNVGVPCLVLIDERVGRAVATELGLAIVGTVGLIVQAKKRGLIPSARALFASLLEQDFRIGTELIREALVRAGET